MPARARALAPARRKNVRPNQPERLLPPTALVVHRPASSERRRCCRLARAERSGQTCHARVGTPGRRLKRADVRRARRASWASNEGQGRAVRRAPRSPTSRRDRARRRNVCPNQRKRLLPPTALVVHRPASSGSRRCCRLARAERSGQTCHARGGTPGRRLKKADVRRAGRASCVPNEGRTVGRGREVRPQDVTARVARTSAPINASGCSSDSTCRPPPSLERALPVLPARACRTQRADVPRAGRNARAAIEKGWDEKARPPDTRCQNGSQQNNAL